MIVVLTIYAINCSYFTQGTSYVDGFAIHKIGEPLISADVLIFFKIMFFGHMYKLHVNLYTFIVILKFLLQS